MVSWGQVKDADGYLVYATYCGTPLSQVTALKSTNKLSYTIKKIDGKALILTKSVKVRIKAYKLVDGKKVILGKTIIAHAAGSEIKNYTNAKKINVSAAVVSLKTGKSYKIKAKTVLQDKSKKSLSKNHASLYRYASSNTSVAKVSKNGKITAVGSGTCTVYVYALNGYAKKIKVTCK